MSRWDTIVIGAGHNGLVCAGLLAQAGQRVLLLEAGSTVGGLAAPREFHPGFRAPVAHDVGHFARPVADALGLSKHGLRWADACPLVGLGEDGAVRVIQGARLSGATTADQAAWPGFMERMQAFAAALEPYWLRTIPRIAKAPLGELAIFGRMGWSLRRLGKPAMREFLRQFALPTRDLADEVFEDETLKALIGWDGLIGSRMAPRSPNNAVLMMLYRMSGAPVRSVSNLVAALEAAARAGGAEIRTDAPVAGIRIEGTDSGLGVNGVTLADGSVLDADRVVSSADPQTTLLGLVGARHLEIGFTNRIRRLRCNGLVAKLHLALDGLPAFEALDQPVGRLVIAGSQDEIEFAFDGSKYGEPPDRPVLEATFPTLQDPSLAPKGGHVLSAHVLYVPTELRGGWTESARNALAERVLDRLEAHAPGLRRHVLGQELLTPKDIEARHGVTGGHWHHTEFALDQMLMMRPTYEAAQYRTPIDGLWLCGAGTHPAGDLTGAAGHNAAREILR